MPRAGVAVRRRSSNKLVRRKPRRRPNKPASPPPDLQVIDPGVWYTEKEAAYFLRLRSPKTLTIWRCKGRHAELVWSKKTGRILYLGADILKFLQGTASPPAPVSISCRARRARKAARP